MIPNCFPNLRQAQIRNKIRSLFYTQTPLPTPNFRISLLPPLITAEITYWSLFSLKLMTD